MSIFTELSAPFDPADVSWRCGPTNSAKTKGMALAFVDARVVMDRLNDVVGPQNWQNRYSHANGKTVCDLAVRYDGEWIWKADGAGDSDMEAEKGALSDAFKRAAVRHGVGMYLYSLKSPWVEIEPMGAKSFRIKDSELPKLAALLTTHAVEQKLILTGAAESNKGLDAYKSYFEKLTDAERKIVLPYHDQYKRNAQFVSNNKKAA